MPKRIRKSPPPPQDLFYFLALDDYLDNCYLMRTCCTHHGDIKAQCFALAAGTPLSATIFTASELGLTDN